MFQSAGRITIPGNPVVNVLMMSTSSRFNPPGGSRYLGTCGAGASGDGRRSPVSIRREDHDTWELLKIL